MHQISKIEVTAEIDATCIYAHLKLPQPAFTSQPLWSLTPLSCCVSLVNDRIVNQSDFIDLCMTFLTYYTYNQMKMCGKRKRKEDYKRKLIASGKRYPNNLI